MRRPASAAGITLVSLKTSTSPGFRSSGRSRTTLSSKRSGLTTRSFAESRGLAGRSAIRSAGAGSSRIAALRHEAFDHPVEGRPVIEALARQLLDAGDVTGSKVGPERNRHPPALEIHIEGVFEIGCHHLISFITFIDTILSGLAGGSPRSILSTHSMPFTTSPHTVYCPSRKPPSANMMKNWLLAELGSCALAMPTVPRAKWALENSACILGSFDPPVPVPVGSPVCAMKPSITR